MDRKEAENLVVDMLRNDPVVAEEVQRQLASGRSMMSIALAAVRSARRIEQALPDNTKD